MPDMNDKKRNITCSFCGKPQELVGRLFQGSGAFICDECVSLCSSLLKNEDYDDFDEDFFLDFFQSPWRSKDCLMNMS